MLTNDRILDGGEITSAGVFKKESFYIFLLPKTSEADETCLLNVKLHAGAEKIDFPFNTNVWNPVTVKEINLQQGTLDKYRVFWGTEHLF